MDQYWMGIDNGGSAIKCGIFDGKGNALALCSQPAPPYLPGGYSNRDPDAVWAVNCQVIRGALEQAGLTGSQIQAVSLCGYGGGICFVDGKGQAVYPLVVSTDTRALPQVEQLNHRPDFLALVEEHTLQTLWPGHAAPLLLWFSQNLPQVLAHSTHILNIKDYIRLRLTGIAALERTDASNFGICNIHTGALEPDILSLAAGQDAARLLPSSLLRPTDWAGRVTTAAARETGLQAGTPVAAGLYDVSACALASGVVDPSALCLVTGTWGIACAMVPEPISHRNVSLISHTYLPSYRLAEEGGATCTCNLDWYLEQFLAKSHPHLSRDGLYDLCRHALERLAPGDGPLFLPYLYNCATPADGGCFLGLRSSHGELHLLRGVLEGILYSLLFYSEPLRLDAASRCGFQRLRVSGGITQSQPWTQMLCDMMQLPLEVVPPQPGLRGAAICAAVGSGAFSSMEEAISRMVPLTRQYLPSPDRGFVYRQGYRRYRNALSSMAQLYEQNKGPTEKNSLL